MLRSLLSRNIALMAVIVLVSQIATLTLVALLMLRPQADRLAGILSRNIAMVSTTIASLPPEQRAKTIARINAEGAIRVLPGTSPPVGTGGSASVIETAVLRGLARKLHMRDEVYWRGGGSMPLWVRLELGGEYYWISIGTPSGWAPDGTFLASIALALALALLTGIILQRRVNRPLAALADALDALPQPHRAPPLSADGPDEVVALARSFNRLSARLDAQEADRAFMLAGLSHDLKTPLAKIRLGLAIDPVADGETGAMIDRQLDRLDGMLDQFLDFGRGTEAEVPAVVSLSGAVDTALAGAGAAVEVAVVGAREALVRVRPLAFERSIINLVRNALAHGAPPVRIEIEETGQHIAIRVIDSGPGVSADQLAQLHQPFVRGNASRPSDGGAGLGLAIAARFASENGGTLKLANRPEGGFEAVLMVPRA